MSRPTVFERVGPPDKFTAADHWIAYLQEALVREQGARCTDGAIVKLAGRRLSTIARDEGVDPFMLACAIDCLALIWDQAEDVKPTVRFSASYLLEPLWERGGSAVVWRHVWFSRFARTEHEVGFYAEWLTVLEVAEDTEPGREGRSELLTEAKERLEAAEANVREREKPVFKFNAVKAMLGTS